MPWRAELRREVALLVRPASPRESRGLAGGRAPTAGSETSGGGGSGSYCDKPRRGTPCASASGPRATLLSEKGHSIKSQLAAFFNNPDSFNTLWRRYSSIFSQLFRTTRFSRWTVGRKQIQSMDICCFHFLRRVRSYRSSAHVAFSGGFTNPNSLLRRHLANPISFSILIGFTSSSN